VKHVCLRLPGHAAAGYLNIVGRSLLPPLDVPKSLPYHSLSAVDLDIEEMGTSYSRHILLLLWGLTDALFASGMLSSLTTKVCNNLVLHSPPSVSIAI
jgi:hypothetical protein